MGILGERNPQQNQTHAVGSKNWGVGEQRKRERWLEKKTMQNKCKKMYRTQSYL